MAASAQDDDLICLNISWFGFQNDHLAETRQENLIRKSQQWKVSSEI